MGGVNNSWLGCLRDGGLLDGLDRLSGLRGGGVGAADGSGRSNVAGGNGFLLVGNSELGGILVESGLVLD